MDSTRHPPPEGYLVGSTVQLRRVYPTRLVERIERFHGKGRALAMTVLK